MKQRGGEAAALFYLYFSAVPGLDRPARHATEPFFEQPPPAHEQERHQVRALAAKVQEVTGGHVEVAFVDQGCTGEQPKQDAQASGIELVVVKVDEAQRGFVLLPRRWVVERRFGWMARFRRLVRDYERTPAILAGLPFVAFAMRMLA